MNNNDEKKIPLISILTPTYNREYCISNLFESLKKQKDINFEWIVIDDGSTDDTYKLFDELESNLFEIYFYKKKNGGKHTAINFGVPLCSGKLIFIVDSDDTLTEDATQKIKEKYIKYQMLSDVAGFSFLRKYPDGQINVKSKHNGDYIGSYNEVRILDNTPGDMAEVYYKNILLEYPFPEFKNERFLGEAIVWIEIGKKYDLVYINEAIYVSAYLTDGLTNNRRILNIASPNGSFASAKQMLSIHLRMKQLIIATLQLIVYGKFSNKEYKEIYSQTKHKLVLTLLYLPGLILYALRKRKYVVNTN